MLLQRPLVNQVEVTLFKGVHYKIATCAISFQRQKASEKANP